MKAIFNFYIAISALLFGWMHAEEGLMTGSFRIFHLAHSLKSPVRISANHQACFERGFLYGQLSNAQVLSSGHYTIQFHASDQKIASIPIHIHPNEQITLVLIENDVLQKQSAPFQVVKIQFPKSLKSRGVAFVSLIPEETFTRLYYRNERNEAWKSNIMPFLGYHVMASERAYVQFCFQPKTKPFTLVIPESDALLVLLYKDHQTQHITYRSMIEFCH